jgi:hypothetical protein
MHDDVPVAINRRSACTSLHVFSVITLPLPSLGKAYSVIGQRNQRACVSHSPIGKSLARIWN